MKHNPDIVPDKVDRIMGRFCHAKNRGELRAIVLDLYEQYEFIYALRRDALVFCSALRRNLGELGDELAALKTQRPSTTEALNAAERERLAYLEQHVISLNERINGAAKEGYMDGFARGRNEGVTEGMKRFNDLQKPGAIAFVPQETITTTCVGVLSGNGFPIHKPPNLFTRISAFGRSMVQFGRGIVSKIPKRAG